VPFKFDDGAVLMNEKYTSDVTNYTKRIALNFKPSAADLREAEELYLSTRRSDRIKGAAGIVVGLAVFWAVVWVIGWIVRGFLGIRTGQDHRAPPVGRSTSE
jgi:ferric-dicitrate binding protein FerR (iron transport regulator)